MQCLERINRLREALSAADPGWDTALVVGRVNQFYFAGTMQDAVLAIRRDGSVRYFARKSFGRARAESPLPGVARIGGYRDMLEALPANLGRVYLETELMPVAMLDRMRKYFTMESVASIEPFVARLRSVKDEGELDLVRESASQHAKLMRDIVPGLLREGMSETELSSDIYAAMLRLGHHGVSRFAMFQMDMIVGQIGFGTNSMYPTCFDGPGGMLGQSAAVPLLGSRERRLAKGDLVFVDVGYGVGGYHSDKTQVYSYGAEPPALARDTHAACREVLSRARSVLRAGVAAREVYAKAMEGKSPLLAVNFMGMGDEAVKFLGHGVGLQIDEYPVIMPKNADPLVAGQVIALEPKCGIEGYGMVGVEETYLVTDGEAVCLTGGDADILVV